MRLPTVGRKGPPTVWVSALLLILSPFGAVAACFELSEGAILRGVIVGCLVATSATFSTLNVMRWWKNKHKNHIA